MKYYQIVFDIDGTLIDTEYAVLHSLQDTMIAITGKAPAIESLAFALGITGKSTLRQLGVADIPSALSLWDKNMLAYMDTVGLFKDIEKLLNRLHAMGYGLGIVTSKTKNEFEHDFSIFGIDSYFGTVVCADDTARHKPDPAPLLKYMELTHTGNQDILYIGDSPYDMECAAKAGVDFALAGWGAKTKLHAAVLFDTVLEAIQFFDKE